MRGVERQCELAELVDIPGNACRDSADLPILGVAVGGSADLLVTVDKDLLALGTYQGIPILKPGEFWRRTGTSK